MAEILKGAPVASAITEELKTRCAALKEKDVFPTIAIVRVGERPDDLAYERAAVKRLESIGIAVRQYVLDEKCDESEVIGAINEINIDSGIHGCLMFRPLPDRKAEIRASARLVAEKDLDCMTGGSLAGVFAGNGEGFPPCTAQAVIELCDHYGIELEGREVVVIGRSLVIGKPVSMLLLGRNATVTLCHTKTRNLAEVCHRADIIVAAAGRAGLVTEEFVSGRIHSYDNPDEAMEISTGHEQPTETPAWINSASGQIVIDVGINVTADGRLTGDVDFENVAPRVAAITPVPGGVGSITTAVLAKHLIIAAEKTL